MSTNSTECGSPQLDFLNNTLLALLGRDANGPVLRLVHVETTGNFVTCDNQGMEFNLNQLVRFDNEGNPALAVHISNAP